MFKHISLFFVLTVGLSSQVSATLILEQYSSGSATPNIIGGYTMTDFGITNGGLPTGSTTNSISSPIDGILVFEDKYTNSANLTRTLASMSTTWWVNGEGSDYDVFSTDLNSITIILPENTRAFSFNVGADLGSTGNNAWLTAIESDGNGIDAKYKFNVNRTNTPGFGIYTDNSNGSCSALTSVTIDPLLWGFGNFSINQNSCSTSVPEPMPIALIALGLLGLGFVRKANKA